MERNVIVGINEYNGIYIPWNDMTDLVSWRKKTMKGRDMDYRAKIVFVMGQKTFETYHNRLKRYDTAMIIMSQEINHRQLPYPESQCYCSNWGEMEAKLIKLAEFLSWKVKNWAKILCAPRQILYASCHF